MDETLERLGETIAGALSGSVVGHWIAHDELTITATARDIVQVVTFLRDDERCQFFSFIDITAVDWPARERRFDVVYHLLSPTKNHRVRIKIEAGEDTRIPSIIDVFPGADWFERETYDLYGFSLLAIPICGGSSPITASRVIPCARIFRSPASSRCVTTMSRSVWFMTR